MAIQYRKRLNASESIKITEEDLLLFEKYKNYRDGFHSSVYLVLLNDYVIYVDSSVTLYNRVTDHKSLFGSGIKVVYLKVNKISLSSIEKRYIKKYDPPYNIRCRNQSYSHQVSSVQKI